jgi:hypothetical protein
MVLAVAAGCASQEPELASITRMMPAPARELSCALQFVQASIFDLSPLGKYDILGYVTVQQLAVADPFAEENRRIVRPKACELGGQFVALMLSSTSMGIDSDASVTAYAVLREKSAPISQPPQAF